MKFLYIGIGVTITAVIILQLYTMNAKRNIETYPYKVKKKYDTFEIRSYEATLFSSVKINSKEYKDASRKGFSILAGYIFGGNKTNEKIAMTSPVAMSLEESMTVMFMVPKKFNKETLPQPNESQIEFKEEPAKIVAAITFDGWASDERIEAYKQQLKAALDNEGIAYTNNFYFLGYNPPFELLNRRNEVIVELANDIHQ
ncbi:MAG TPA: heme-binding protein [Chitinophagales bacterium]|nr:heme-binding protein [Chitinophagales bacterium]